MKNIIRKTICVIVEFDAFILAGKKMKSNNGSLENIAVNLINFFLFRTLRISSFNKIKLMNTDIVTKNNNPTKKSDPSRLRRNTNSFIKVAPTTNPSIML